MNKRLEMLEKLTSSGKADSFAWYALALEYKKEKHFEQALSTFQKLRELDADYVPMYLMTGQMLIELERGSDAAPWLEQGLQKARAKGDLKAASELEHALQDIE
jgi:tetratricopeptide (TPR) repeat protein